jgi:ethanolamine utilization protein EutQ
MPKLIAAPKIIETVVENPEKIEEYIGRWNTGTDQVSVARISAPKGWQEPGQIPAFQEIFVVLDGCLKIEYKGGIIEAKAGQAVIESPGEWVRHSSPYENGVIYMAICTPAFSPEKVKRDVD